MSWRTFTRNLQLNALLKMLMNHMIISCTVLLNIKHYSRWCGIICSCLKAHMYAFRLFYVQTTMQAEDKMVSSGVWSSWKQKCS